MILAEHNNVQLLWVPGHKGTEGNESADQLAKIGSLHPYDLNLPVVSLKESHGGPPGTVCPEST
jgi:hypothetical protein